MHYLKINNLSFKYENINIFTHLNISFTSTWSCLVGCNGSGKTTLLKLIAKILKPDFGNIEGNGLVYYCPQELYEKPLGYEEFVYSYNSYSFKIKQLLEIEDEWLYRWETLSFGERKRIQIAIALFMQVDVLLLDEPTNHLDIKTKKLVLKSLEAFKGIGILVSHDRELLNSLCINTYIIKNEEVYHFKTSYDTAIKELNSHFNHLYKENEKIDLKLKKLKNDIQIQKEKVSRSKQRFSKKDIDKKDKSQKEKINLAKLTGKDKNDSKLVSTIVSKTDDLVRKKSDLEKVYDTGILIKEQKQKASKLFISLEKGEINLYNQKILTYPKIEITNKDKIAIIGDNGVGKSSFLAYIINFLEGVKYLYIPQELDSSQIDFLFEEIQKLDNEKKGELFTFVQRLSSNPKKLLNSKTASPGELRKLLIAKALLDEIELIILDEPTNHMDLDSIVSIEEALKEYKNSLIIISHDMQFIKNIRAKIWQIETIEKTINSLVIS